MFYKQLGSRRLLPQPLGMRPLTEEVTTTPEEPAAGSLPHLLLMLVVEQETRVVFEKLHNFIGKNIKHLVDRPDESYVFRLHQNKVLYVKASIMRRATNVRLCG